MADTSNTEAAKAEVTSATAEKSVEQPSATTENAQAPATVTDSAPEPPKDEPASKQTEPVKEESKDALKEEAPTTPVAQEKKDEPAADKPKEAAPAKTPLEQFDEKLPAILKDVDQSEMWGVTLTSPGVPTSIVLQKFLNANDGDLAKAVEQLKGALKFRKEKKPLELLAKTFSTNKFADLGAVTVYPVKEGGVPEVFTWNMYGNVKGKMDEVFVPLEEFMDYRIALQELGIQQLKLSSATEPITADRDPYKIIQVHDYKSISFMRQNPNVKAASTEVIKKFALAYPELLKEKFFVNVPAIMGWMYAIIKVFVAEKTAKKFHPMANGANLAAEFKTGGLDWKQLPKEYGGEGGSGDGKMKDIPGLINELKFA